MESTQGDYASGLAEYRGDLEYLRDTHGMHMMFKTVCMQFGTQWTVANTTYYPQYVRDNGWLYKGNNAVSWNRWDSAAMDAYIAMFEAIAAEFDSEPFFDGVFVNAVIGLVNPAPE